MILLKILLLSSLILSFPKPETKKSVINYVSFGASQATGFGLHGFLPEELSEDPHVIYENDGLDRDGYYSSGINFYSDLSYPVLVKKELEKRYDVVNFKQLGINSLRAYDLAYILDSNLEKDGYTNWRLGDENKGWMHDLNRERHDQLICNGVTYNYDKEETNMREDYIEAVKNANLISYDLGCNDLFTYISQMIGTFIDEPDKMRFTNDLRFLIGEKADKYFKIKDILCEKLLGNLIGLDASLLKTVSFAIDTLAYSICGYIVGFERAMDIIYELNPNVEVVVVGVQNLLNGASLKIGNFTLDFGLLGSALSSILNFYSHFISKHSNQYYFADLSKRNVVTFREEIKNWDGDVEHLSQSFVECINCYEGKFLATYKIKEEITKNLDEFVNYYNNIPGNTSQITNDAEKEKLAQELCSRAVKYALVTFAQAFNTVFKNPVADINETNDNLVPEYSKMALPSDNSVFKAILENMASGNDDKALFECAKNTVNNFLSDPAYFSRTVFLGLSFGNSYFSHPSEEGHAEMAKAIINAFDNKSVAKETIIEKGYAAIDKIFSLPGNFMYGTLENIVSFINQVTTFIYSLFNKTLIKYSELIIFDYIYSHFQKA